ncbi:MAG: hypothetical protein ACREGB_00045 [Candidatus Saccharimonadales bacterium]
MKGKKGIPQPDKAGAVVRRIQLAQQGQLRIADQLKAPIPAKHAHRPDAYKAMLRKDAVLIQLKVERVQSQVVISGSKK